MQMDDQTDPLWNSQPISSPIRKAVLPQHTAQRWRIVFSDGEHVMHALLATQLNHLFEEPQLVKNNIVCIESLSWVMFKLNGARCSPRVGSRPSLTVPQFHIIIACE